MKILKSKFRGFREMRRRAKKRREYPCGHSNSKENTILQRRGSITKPTCRYCLTEIFGGHARLNRAIKDIEQPGWRERVAEKRRLTKQRIQARLYIIKKAHADIAREMAG